MRIGIFDSGLGGLTVARAIVDRLPGIDMIYFGDTARTPYGSKSRETVIRYACENTDFLIEKGAQLIVMACNTAASVATDVLREKYNLPIFEVITPAATLVSSMKNTRKVGIIGTRATINSNVYTDKISQQRPDIRVHAISCPLLVPLVEEGWINKPETRMIVKKYLHPLKVRQIDTLILACTHYPILKSIIQKKIGRRVKVIDSAQAVAKQLESYFENLAEKPNTWDQQGTTQFYVSDITPYFEKIAESIFKRRIPLEVATG
ncbi:glutamate racemase [Candidatus Magnetomorum sp. HK-1]|nr:glutamate racemase [Candidatus Magnetomorum sp. HK-1]